MVFIHVFEDSRGRLALPDSIEQLFHAYKAGEKFWAYLQGVSAAGNATAKTAAEYLGFATNADTDRDERSV